MAKEKASAADLIEQAQAAMNRHNHADARALLLRALETSPDHPDAHYGLATVCFLQADMLGAAHHFKEVTRHDPLRAGAFINLGALYNHLGREEDAIAALRRGIQLDPGRAEGFYNLGLVYRRIDQPLQAIEAYREAVRLQPDLADAFFNLANILLDEERFDEARVHYEKALALRPGWAEAQQGIAIVRDLLAEDVENGGGPVADEKVENAPPPRSLDPILHGAILGDIHRTSAEVESLAKILTEEQSRQLETSLKELSACLLKPDVAGHELDKSLSAFEAAAERFSTLRKQLEKLHGHIQKSADDLSRS